jgi:prephenate dehydrogenase
MNKSRYHVIGAVHGIGNWFSFHLAENGYQVFCYDVQEFPSNDSLNLAKIPAGQKFKISKNNNYDKYSEHFQKNDYVLIATPDKELENLEKQLVPFIKDCVVVCLFSVQETALKRISSWNISNFFGCHPLFSHTVANPTGQILALVNFNKENDLQEKFKAEMDSIGFITETENLSSKEHDEKMSIIQALPHFTYLIFAKTLSDITQRHDQLLKIQTPPFRFLYAFMCRYLKNNTPETNASIQSSNYAQNIWKTFSKTCCDIAGKFNSDSSIDKNIITKTIKIVEDSYTGANIDEGVKFAIKAVDNLSDFENTLYKYKNNKEPFVFYYYSEESRKNEIKIVIIQEINATEVKCIESTKILNDKYAIGLYGNSANNYKKLGTVFSKKPVTFKKRRMFLLKEKELKEFWNLQVHTVTNEICIENRKGLSIHFFEDCLPKLVDGLKECKYNNIILDNGVKKVHLTINYFPSKSKKEIVAKIEEILDCI